MANKALLTVTLIMAAVAPAQARHHHKHKSSKPERPAYSWERHNHDLTPVAVKSFETPKPVVTAAAKPVAKSFGRKMNLEDGLYVRGTQFITRPDIRSRDLFILHATQSLEGGFDTVNLYDKGIFSWGLMQWTARSGSLTECLKYIKRNLISQGDRKVWQKYFVANGVDVNSDNIVLYGKPMLTPQDMRLAIRGTIKVGQGDPNLMNHWVTTFARAGRQGQIAGLEIAYASRVVDSMMNSRLDNVPYRVAGRNGVTPADLAGDDPFTQALMFAIWTNNPRHARQYIGDAARAARSEASTDDPSLWAPGAFSDALFRECRESTFGNWSQRASLIDERANTVRTASASELSPYEAHFQQVIADRKQARLLQIASRHAARKKAATIAALPKSKPEIAVVTVKHRPVIVAVKPIVVRISGITSALETHRVTEMAVNPIAPLNPVAMPAAVKPAFTAAPSITSPQTIIKTYGRMNVLIPCEPVAASPLPMPASVNGGHPDEGRGADAVNSELSPGETLPVPDPHSPIHLPGGTIPALPK